MSDYCRLVAEALAAAGDEVHVWTPPGPQPSPTDSAVRVHRLPGPFGLRALLALAAGLNRLPRPYRILVQYVPHAFRWKAMNVPFCLWLLSRRGDPRWVMFHEVAFPWRWSQPLKHQFLGLVNRLMASLVVRAAQRVFVSIPAWEPLLRTVADVRQTVRWLPVPSTMPTWVSAALVATVRARIQPLAQGVVLGHFGTFGGGRADQLAAIFPPLLTADPRRVGLFIGKNSDLFVREMESRHPHLRGRWHATGRLSPELVAAHLVACEILVQPYPDGVSGRRTSLMAGLALGRPIVTTDGPLTEPVWREARAVRLTPAASPTAAVAAVDELLANDDLRADLGLRAAAWYARQFALEQTIQVLRTEAIELGTTFSSSRAESCPAFGPGGR